MQDHQLLMALQNLQTNSDIVILLADKSNHETVIIFQVDSYSHLNRDSTARIEWEIPFLVTSSCIPRKTQRHLIQVHLVYVDFNYDKYLANMLRVYTGKASCHSIVTFH